jgi:sulfur carrier protein
VIVELNGATTELADGSTLADLVSERTGSLRGSAVAVDGAVVPRGDWHSYPIRAGQRVELITAVQGG